MVFKLCGLENPSWLPPLPPPCLFLLSLSFHILSFFSLSIYYLSFGHIQKGAMCGSAHLLPDCMHHPIWWTKWKTSFLTLHFKLLRYLQHWRPFNITEIWAYICKMLGPYKTKSLTLCFTPQNFIWNWNTDKLFEFSYLGSCAYAWNID